MGLMGLLIRFFSLCAQDAVFHVWNDIFTFLTYVSEFRQYSDHLLLISSCSHFFVRLVPRLGPALLGLLCFADACVSMAEYSI